MSEKIRDLETELKDFKDKKNAEGNIDEQVIIIYISGISRIKFYK